MTRARSAVPRQLGLAALVVFAAAWLAYGVALCGDYVFDDIHSVSANPALHDLSMLGRYWVDPKAFSPGSGVMYRPALLTSFALNWAVSPAAWSLKAGNVLLHALTAVLFAGWLWRLSRARRASLFGGIAFAVHPLASEAVNLVSARSELLVLLGLFVVLHGHLSWSRRQWGPWALAVMLLGTVLACGSKETGVVAPCLCGVQALVLRQGGWRRLAWGRQLLGGLPVLAVVLGYLVVRKLLLGEATVQLLDRAGDDPLSGHGRSLAVQLATMGTLLPGALLQVLAPFRLSLDPVVHYQGSFTAPAVLGGWALVLGLSAGAWWPGPGARLRRLGAALAACVALPWIVVPLNMPYAEHRMYGPLAGVLAIGVAGLPRLRGWLRARAHDGRAHSVRFACGALAVAAIVLSAQRSWLYRDERDLWRVELARNPESFRSWWGLGACEYRRGDLAAAVAPLQRAHELNPRHFDTLRNYVEVLASLPDDTADPTVTLAMAQRLTTMSPKDPWARTLEVQALLQRGRVHADRDAFAQAEALALSCLQIAPPKGYVYRLAAMARRGLGDLGGALAHLDTSIANGLKAPEVRLDRAAVLRELGRHREAQRELLIAQREAPGDAMVMAALAQFAAPGR